MKRHYRLSNEEGLQRLKKDWLISFCEFFEERIIFKSSQTLFLALLDPPMMKADKSSRVLLFAHNKGEKTRSFESSISIGLIQAGCISRIKHARPLPLTIKAGDSVCAEFPLEGNNTSKGRYKIRVNVKDTGEVFERLAEKFSIISLSDFISVITHTGVAGSVLTRWALSKLRNEKIQVSVSDALYLGSSSGTQIASETMGKNIGKSIDGVVGGIVRDSVGTTLSGLADGALTELFDTSSPTLTLTVV